MATTTRPDRILDLQVRRKLYEQVQKYPGLHLRALARSQGLQTNHAKYHLRQLERHGLVSSRKDDGYWLFWPRGRGSSGMRDEVDRDAKRLLAMLRRPVPLHVTLLLLEREQESHSGLLADVNVAHSTLHYHLQKMEAAGLVQSERDGKQRIYRLCDAPRVAGMLVDYRPPRALVRRFLETWESLDLGDAAGAPTSLAKAAPADHDHADAPEGPADAVPGGTAGKGRGADERWEEGAKVSHLAISRPERR